MKHSHATSGERLAALLHDEHLSGARWDGLSAALAITGKPQLYTRYFRELTAVSVACRLVAYASGLCERGDGGIGLDDENPLFRSRLSTYLREYLGVYDKAPFNKLYRHVVTAHRASRRDIPDGTRKAMQSAAKRKSDTCYMCGQSLLFDDSVPHAKITIDHIWPQCFGGESEEENLLPACVSCNTSKKRNFAAWSLVAVQSVALGWNPTKNARDRVDGTIRFARHHFAVWVTASELGCTLRNAYLQVGPWTDITFPDVDDDADFFNIHLTTSTAF